MEFVGGTSSATRNNFNTDVTHGIISKGSMNLRVTDCIFNGSIKNSIKLFQSTFSNIIIEDNSFENIQHKAISTQNSIGCEISIQRNEFENVITGISAKNFAGCFFAISENYFLNTAVVDVTNFDFHNTAITLNCYGRDDENLVYVWDNTIQDCRIGIHANGVNGLYIGLDPAENIFGNVIEFNYSVPPTSGLYYEGIWIQNTNRPIVVENQIRNSTAFGNAPEFRGIDIQSVTNGRINCNQILNMNRSMNFMGICKGTLLRGNNMTGYQEAINLDGASMSPQFQINDITGDQEPLDNVWNDAANPQGMLTDRVTGNGNPFNWYYQQGVPIGNVFNPLDNGTISLVINAFDDPAAIVICSDYTDRQMRDVKFGALVGDSLEFNEFENENAYLSKSIAYREILKDSSLLNYGTPEDIEYQNFFTNLESSNIGHFESIYELAADSSTFLQAVTINASIVDTNSIEYYRKSVNDILLNNQLTGEEFTETDSLILSQISYLSFYVAGEAVYLAPAMLELEVHPQFNSMRKSNPKLDEMYAVEVLRFKLSPNPTSDFFKIEDSLNEIDKIQLLSSNGKWLKEFTQFETEYSVKEFSNGFYQIKLTTYDNQIYFLKLIIVK